MHPPFNGLPKPTFRCIGRPGIPHHRNNSRSAQIPPAITWLIPILETTKFRACLRHEAINTLTRTPGNTSLSTLEPDHQHIHAPLRLLASQGLHLAALVSKEPHHAQKCSKALKSHPRTNGSIQSRTQPNPAIGSVIKQ